MKKEIYSKNAPKPIGPYSQAIMAGGFLFISGQIAINPKSNMLKNKTIEEETQQIMENINAILKKSKLSFSNIVKTTIYLKNMDYFDAVNFIYSKYFKGVIAPARETVAVVGLPKNVSVEISVIAKIN